MRNSIAIMGCLALVGLPLAVATPANAQNGGAMQPSTSNYTGDHAPNNATGGTAGNPPTMNSMDGSGASTTTTTTDSNGRKHHSATPTTYNSSSAPHGGNDNPNLNSSDKGGGQPR